MVLQPYSATGSSPPTDTRKTTSSRLPVTSELNGAQDPDLMRLALSDVTVQLARALRSKDEILQNLSHEFRSPLTLIIGYAETLSNEYWGHLTEDQSKAAAVILEQSRRLQCLIERMLRLQAVDDGTIDRLPIPFDALAEQVIEKWQPQIALAGGSLVVELAPAMPTVLCDSAMLNQAFDELLDNAVKYGLQMCRRTESSPTAQSGASRSGRSHGVIRLRAWARDGYVHISVTDYGIGIAKDEIEQIFDRFYQVDRGLTRSSEGVGIGLALAKSIVQAHNGAVRVHSLGANQGSTFTVSLPAVAGNNGMVDKSLASSQHPPA